MADPQSEAEKIRLKRMAKLGGPSPSQSSTSAENQSSASAAPNDGQSKPTAPKPSPIPQVFTGAAGTGSRIVEPKPSTPRPTVSRKPEPVAQDPESWADRTLGSIFKITLSPEQKADAQGSRLTYLEGVKNELVDSGLPLKLTTEVLDGAIIEAASNTPDRKPLNYLLGCWKRVIRVYRNVQSNAKDPRLDVIKEAKRLCMSYCIFAITMPDMFGVEPGEKSPLLEHLERDPESDSGICPDFLADAVLRFEDDDSIREALVAAVEQMSEELSKMTMNDNFKPYMTSLRTFVKFQQLCSAIAQSPKFIIADVAPERLEKDTLLGPFFALSPLNGDVAENYFRGYQAQGDNFVATNQNAVRLTSRTHQDELADITNCLVKAGKDSREPLLNWFALVVNKNHKRRATWVDMKTVSSDAFVINVTTILDRLCEPFMDATFTKMDRIDVDYLRRSPRVIIADETKLNADQKTSDEFYAQRAPGENNFISEIFFLTVAAHHYGTEAASNRIEKQEKELKRMQKQVEQYEAERPRYASNPAQLALFERHLKKFKNDLERKRCMLKATQGVLLDEALQTRSLQLMRYVIVWMLRIVQPESQYPKKQISLPLAEEQSMVFRCLPEYLLEDVVDNFKFVTGTMPQIISATQCEELVIVCITFLRNSEYVKNPYLKSGLVSILRYGVWEFRGRSRGILGDLLNSSTFCHKHLLHALMKFYIEAETTGGHNQFYDKFNIRYDIFQVMQCIWPNTVYRENLNIESKVNVDFFVRFVNLLLNDVTYVLGEAFASFKKIHSLQNELDDTSTDLDETQRQEKQEALEEAQSRAKSNMQLTNETVKMLKLFTEVLPGPFTMPEVVQRLADMLDYNLESMVGPRQRDIKVNNPSSYFFNPIALLADLMRVYLNLKDQTAFHTAVARDGRSYKPYNLEHAASIITRQASLSPQELKAWTRLSSRIAAAKEAEDQADDDLGEIPDEFLDPILATLMEDPVILPTSKIVIDRQTIRSHLLNDPQDPFNRQPLTIEEVVPNTELKAKIETFKAEARKRRVDANAASARDVKMGGTEEAEKMDSE